MTRPSPSPAPVGLLPARPDRNDGQGGGPEQPPQQIEQAPRLLAEAGDLIKPLERGMITREHVHAELGEIVLGLKSGRTDPEQVTFFKTVGIAVEDAAAARVAVQNAVAMGLGHSVEW